MIGRVPICSQEHRLACEDDSRRGCWTPPTLSKDYRASSQGLERERGKGPAEELRLPMLPATYIRAGEREEE